MNKLSLEEISEKNSYNKEYEYKIYMKEAYSNEFTPLTSCEWIFISDNICVYFYNKKKDMYLFFKQQHNDTFYGKLYSTYMEYFYDHDDKNMFIFIVFDNEYEEIVLK